MPWVRRHRRRLPYSWFRTTEVRSHYRMPSGGYAVIVAALVVLLILFLLWRY